MTTDRNPSKAERHPDFVMIPIGFPLGNGTEYSQPHGPDPVTRPRVAYAHAAPVARGQQTRMERRLTAPELWTRARARIEEMQARGFEEAPAPSDQDWMNACIRAKRDMYGEPSATAKVAASLYHRGALFVYDDPCRARWHFARSLDWYGLASRMAKLLKLEAKRQPTERKPVASEARPR